MPLAPRGETRSSSLPIPGHKERYPRCNLFSSTLLPIQPKVYTIKVFTSQSQVLTHLFDSGSGRAVVSRSPLLIQCYLVLAAAPCPAPPPFPRSSGLCNNPPSQWSFHRPYCPFQCPGKGREGKGPTGGAVVVPTEHVSHSPFVAVLLLILGGFLWHSGRSL